MTAPASRGRFTTGINVLANFFGKGWTALLGVVFVPIYAKQIGMESLGVITFFASLQVAIGILDMGLSATVNRELARLPEPGRDQTEGRDLVRTIEAVYWAIAGAVAVGIAALAPFLANHWLQADQLPAETVTLAGVLAGLQLAFQFPQSLYSGGLMGLERQVLLNSIISAVNLARHVGVFLPLWLIRADIVTFLVWQTIVVLLGTLVTRRFLWRSLPVPGHRAAFRLALLKKVGRFTAGVSATAAVTLPLTMADKVLLSRLLPLEDYGYYMLAVQGASALGILVGPFFGAFLPRLSAQAIGGPESDGLGRSYAAGCQWLATLLAPAAAAAVLFAQPLVGLWLHQHDPAKVLAVGSLFALLVAGNYCNGLMNLPYALTLAKGWTRYGFLQNAIASVLYLPLILLATRLYGAAGAAGCWLLLSFACLCTGGPILHRRMLPSALTGWLRHGVAVPTLASAAVLAAARLCIPTDWPPFLQLPGIAAAAAAAVLLLIITLPELWPVRSRLAKFLPG